MRLNDNVLVIDILDQTNSYPSQEIINQQKAHITT